MESFDGKIAVVTGGASGIGAATVRQFATAGVTTYVLDIQSWPLDQQSPQIKFAKCDVTQLAMVQSTIERIAQDTGHIDFLFANAGVHVTGSIDDTSVDDIERVVAVNCKGTFYTLRAVVPLMKTRRSGAIVLTGSDQSLIGKPKGAIYGATKGAIAQLTKSMAIECAAHNVRVNCVCPGAIDTPLYRAAITSYAAKYAQGNEAAVMEAVKEKHPLKRIGQPNEVANLVLFLCSDAASFITGAVIPIDGGYTAQ